MRRRGAMLLELLVALGILVLAASVLLAVFGDVHASIDRDRITARAADLARTRLSEIEAGLVSVEDLRAPTDAGAARGAERGSERSAGRDTAATRGAATGGRSAAPSGGGGASAGGAPSDAASDRRDPFTIDASVSRSAFEGLSLVELRVFHAGAAEPCFVLRQLVSMPGAARDDEERP